MPGRKVTVRAPATSANLGPGFDALGLALDLWNEVDVEVAEAGGGAVEVEVLGEGAGELPRGPENLVARAFLRAVVEMKARLPGTARLVCRNAIPLARGLGSSAAATVAGILAAEAAAGHPLPPERRLALAAEIEGHADNVAACLLGGLVACAPSPTGPFALRLPYAGPPEVALIIPDFRVPTAEARAVLPDTYPRADAIANVQRTAILVGALASGDRVALAHGVADRLHQPYRMGLYRGADAVLGDAAAFGAAAACVSGAGPTLLAFPVRDGDGAARALAEALAGRWRALGVTCTGRALAVALYGARARE